jgi:hypothetical protein
VRKGWSTRWARGPGIMGISWEYNISYIYIYYIV